MGKLTGTKELSDLLGRDALHEAEQATGKSYKEDEGTMALGFLGHLALVQQKHDALDASGDVHMGTPLDEYELKIANIGFRKVFDEEFLSRPDDTKTEALRVWYRSPGILLVYDTYWGKTSVNGGKMYYNWVPDSSDFPWRVTSSGRYSYRSSEDKAKADEIRAAEIEILSGLGWDSRSPEYQNALQPSKDFRNEVFRRHGYVWSGDHDCREALIHNIAMLEQYGTLIEPWENVPFLWLLHHMDTRQEAYDHEAITKSRIGKLPEDVRTCLGI